MTSAWLLLFFLFSACFAFNEFGSEKVLFSIRAGSGHSAVNEFLTGKQTYHGFRNVNPNYYLRIVVQMLLRQTVMASASFDVTDRVKLNTSNWFSSERLIDSTPFTIDKRGPFVDFSIEGLHRSFYIHNRHQGCSSDSGLMGVIERDDKPCTWAKRAKGDFPILYYAKENKVYDESVEFADQMRIILK
uniref:Secreted protein n=1 Tax=Macrostomum lignano TaxID=282301 RepID=A0A1I8FUU3_9PLAT